MTLEAQSIYTVRKMIQCTLPEDEVHLVEERKGGRRRGGKEGVGRGREVWEGGEEWEGEGGGKEGVGRGRKEWEGGRSGKEREEGLLCGESIRPQSIEQSGILGRREWEGEGGGKEGGGKEGEGGKEGVG
jgi:hypothetical protein